MAKPAIQTGAHSTLVYYWEDNGFASSPSDTETKSFGKDAELSAWDGSRNAVELFDPNSREVAEWIKQQFSGSWTADFVLGNPWWNRAVIDTASTAGVDTDSDGTDDYYRHTFSGEQPSSLQIITGNTKSGEDWTLEGCWVDSADVRIEVPGNITVSLRGAYADLTEAQPSTQEAQVTHDSEAMAFDQASLSIGGVVQRLVQSITLTITNSVDPVLELGSETPVDFSPKSRTLTVDHVQTHDDASDDEMERFLGSTSTLDAPSKDAMVLDITNGESGSAKQRLKYDLTNALPNDFSFNGVGNPDQNIENSMTNRPVGVTATAENDKGTAK